MEIILYSWGKPLNNGRGLANIGAETAENRFSKGKRRLPSKGHGGDQPVARTRYQKMAAGTKKMAAGTKNGRRGGDDFWFLKKLSGVRKLTTFYLAKNDHRWVTFISLNTINSGEETRLLKCLLIASQTVLAFAIRRHKNI